MSRALSRLSEVEERVEALHQEQVRGRRGVGGTVGKGKGWKGGTVGRG